MHEGAYAANALITEDESGSLHIFVGTYPKQKPFKNPVDSTIRHSEEAGEINWSPKRIDD